VSEANVSESVSQWVAETPTRSLTAVSIQSPRPHNVTFTVTVTVSSSSRPASHVHCVRLAYILCTLWCWLSNLYGVNAAE